MDENENQLVPGEGENAQFATEQGENQPAPGSEPQEKGPVPYNRFDEVNQQRKQAEESSRQLEEDNRRLNEQLLQVANQPQKKGVFDGLGDDDFPTIGQIRQVQQEQVQQTQQLLSNVQTSSFIASKPDFNEIVGTYHNGRLIGSETVKNLIKENPTMRVLETLPPGVAPYVYQIAKQYKELSGLRAQQNARTEHNAGVENQLVPLSPAAVGGGGGAPTGEPTDKQVDEQWEAAERGDFG